MDLITKTSLQALIQRATDSRNKSIDNAAVEACCGIIKKTPESAYFASKIIASRLQSEDEWEAIQGLSLLDNCMRKCGPYFHTEIAKFRFLNELIKLVSPKFLGARTSQKVRDTVLRLIYSWTISFPQEQKIKEAFDMLKKQGVITENISKTLSDSAEPKLSTNPSKPNLIVDQEFEKKLQKLLSSKNAEDLDAANRMIKNKVIETEKRACDLERVRTNVRLLAEMLDTCQSGEATAEDLQLMGEIKSECERLKPTIFHLAAEAQDRMLTDVLSVSEELTQVIERFEVVKSRNNSNGAPPKQMKQNSSLLDLSPGEPSVPATETLRPSTDLLSESLSVLDLTPPPPTICNALSTTPEPRKPLVSDVDYLGDIFGVSPSVPKNQHGIPLLVTATRQTTPPVDRSKKQKALDELDVLGETMLQKCKMDIEQAKVTENNEPEESGKTDSMDDIMVDLVDSQSLDDVLLCVDEPSLNVTTPTKTPTINNERTVMDSSATTAQSQPSKSSVPVKALTDVSVSMESIKPSGMPPVKTIESSNGVSSVIHLAKDTPRPDVSVYVVTTTSTSALTLTDYHFQVVVPKGCKFKLQPPSTTNLSPHNPFLPPSAITQILLIANPNGLKINLTCMLSFTMDDETVTEVGEVSNLPTNLDVV